MQANHARGFSLIELMVVIAIIVILTVLALPNFAAWLQNSRTRSVAESLQNGLRFAQGEAARLNRLTTVVTSATGWTVSYVPVGTDSIANPLQTSPVGNLDGVTIAPAAAANIVIEFNPLGRVLTSATVTQGSFTVLSGNATFNITNPNGQRKLNVVVSGAGKVLMCDPDLGAYSNTNPDGCP
jgi:type IV fimbrial biogenesis protein FimT